MIELDAVTPGAGGGRGHSDFCLLQGLGLFLWVQNFEFRYLVGCRGFVNYFYGYANLSWYFFGGMSFSTGIFWSVSLKMFILWCFVYKTYINLLVYA